MKKLDLLLAYSRILPARKLPHHVKMIECICGERWPGSNLHPHAFGHYQSDGKLQEHEEILPWVRDIVKQIISHLFQGKCYLFSCIA